MSVTRPSAQELNGRADSQIFVAHGLGKSYELSKVLSNVSFDIANNSIISFVGENGAGKSTLLNIAAGIIAADTGDMMLDGRPYKPSNYHDAVRTGVTRVFQEQSLVLNAPVYENLLISQINEFSPFGLVDRSAMVAFAERVIDEAGIDVRRPSSHRRL